MGSLFAPLFVFVLATGAILGLYAAVTYLPGFLARERIDQRMREAAGTPFAHAAGEDSILKQQVQGPLPLIDRIVGQSRQGSALAKLIEQSGMRFSVSSVLLMSGGCGLAGALFMSRAGRPAVPCTRSETASAASGLSCPRPNVWPAKNGWKNTRSKRSSG